MTKYLICCVLLFAAACANNEEKPKAKTYSNETNRAFEMIERGGSYYLKKPPTQEVKTPQIAPAPAPLVTRKKKIVNQPLAPVAPEAPITPTPQPSKPVKVDERLVEINQNLAFYCMKHRKDSVYGGDEAKCMSFVNKTMKSCQEQHQGVNAQLLKCIQTRLKNKK